MDTATPASTSSLLLVSEGNTVCAKALTHDKEEALGAAAAAAAAAVAHAGHELTWSLLHFNITKLVFGRFEGCIGA
jgi:hypothetical protein